MLASGIITGEDIFLFLYNQRYSFPFRGGASFRFHPLPNITKPVVFQADTLAKKGSGGIMMGWTSEDTEGMLIFGAQKGKLGYLNKPIFCNRMI